MDLGFERAGFEVIWANDNASSVWETYERNFPETTLDKRSLSKIATREIPDNIMGIIGGPPCQSWSVAGKGRGFEDKRGRLFFDFIRIIHDKKPLFFVAENVEGLLSKRNLFAYRNILNLLNNAGDGYEVSVQVLNANDYGVAQNRKRVFFVGYAKEMGKKYCFPMPKLEKPVVKDAIYDLRGEIGASNIIIPEGLKSVPNHEFWQGGYSYIFMSRNRVLCWDEPSFTIQASGRQTSLHPDSPPMEKIGKDVRRFVSGKEYMYRRLTVRECARLQSFPDEFVFRYGNLNSGYKMVGNSVPVNLAFSLAEVIANDIKQYMKGSDINNKRFLASEIA